LDSIREAFHFLTDVRGLVQAGGYIALALIVFTETGLMIGFFLPGDSLLVTAGLFAAKGDLDIVFLNVLLMICAITGDALGYYIGWKLGPALFRKEDSLLFKKRHLLATQEFYERHGGKTIILARFVPVVRTFAPVVAGMANMSYKKFAVYNIVGGVTWVFSMTMLGYLLVTMFPATEQHIEKVIIIVVIASILPGVVEFVRAKTGRRKV
jgi:membrane-associated protein